ncbi:MAG: hypothetical protein RL220_1824, partial [Bacteroidota bacterium]
MLFPIRLANIKPCLVNQMLLKEVIPADANVILRIKQLLPMSIRISLFLLATLLMASCSQPSVDVAKPQEKTEHSGGKLFIIGGGERSDSLMMTMIREAGFREGDYAVMLPMASEFPDSSYIAFMAEWNAVTALPCYKMVMTEADYVNHSRLDSLSKARLIFFGGGDQMRLMSVLRDTPVRDAVHQAWQGGSLIAGTSAGAAVMSQVMITGDQHFAEEYEGTYKKIWRENGVYNTGMGFLDSTIIDQHFVIRSRYNRLLSALCDYPGYMGVGIDESTAIV